MDGEGKADLLWCSDSNLSCCADGLIAADASHFQNSGPDTCLRTDRPHVRSLFVRLCSFVSEHDEQPKAREDKHTTATVIGDRSVLLSSTVGYLPIRSLRSWTKQYSYLLEWR